MFPIFWRQKSGLHGLVSFICAIGFIESSVKPLQSLDNEKKSWRDANDYCSQIWTGAHLAIFPNQFYQSFATSLMTYYTEKPWIGLVNEAQDRNFHWVRTV